MFEYGISFSIFFLTWKKARKTRVSFTSILERVMNNGLLRFLNNHNILSDNQHGFRKHHPTAYALTCLYDKISTVIENKKYTTF